MEFEEEEDVQPEQPIAIYSKWAILGFSIFFSPVVGSVLLMLNLRAIGNKKAGYLMLLFGVAYMMIAAIVLLKVIDIPLTGITPEKLVANPKVIYYSKALDILGAAILAEYFFKRYFQNGTYESKSIWIPLMVVLLLNFLFGGLI
jgi:hypothetical protein